MVLILSRLLSCLQKSCSGSCALPFFRARYSGLSRTRRTAGYPWTQEKWLFRYSFAPLFRSRGRWQRKDGCAGSYHTVV